MSFKSVLGAIALATAATLAHAQVIGISSMGSGSSFYAVGTGISAVLQKIGIQSRMQPMSGSSVYLPVVNRGEIEFAIASSLDLVNSYKGIEGFAGHPNPDLRAVSVVFSVPIGIAVRNDSPIKSIKDLKGVRMPAQFTAQAAMRLQQDTMLSAANLSTADMKPYPVTNYLKGMEALGEGKVDAAMFCVGCAKAQEVNVALASHGGLRFLPLPDTPEALAAMHKIFPSAYLKLFQPASSLPGVVAPTRLMAYSGFLVGSTHVPDELVYKTVKALYENKPTLEAATQYLKTFDPKMMAEATSVPYHPGAEKFYKEVGEWPPKSR